MFATWEISFKAIEEKNPKAAELLLVCGFFDHEDIQEKLLRRGLGLEKHGMTMRDSISKTLRMLIVLVRSYLK